MYKVRGRGGTAAVLATCLLTVCSPSAARAQSDVSEESSETVPESRIVDVTIVSLAGNQMTYRIDQIVGEEETEENTEEVAESGRSEEASSEEHISADSYKPAMPTQGDESSEMPTMPAQGDESSEMPTMPTQGDGDESSDKPSMSMQGGDGESLQMPSKSDREESWTETLYIPVSAPVWSTSGTQVSYTILQAGDTLEITFETDENGSEIITGIQILEVSDSGSSSSSGQSSGFGGMMSGDGTGGDSSGSMSMPGGGMHGSSSGGMQMPGSGGPGSS